MGNYLEIAGGKFGRLTARERVLSGKKVSWLCDCHCGGVAVVATNQLTSGKTQSCGCLRVEHSARVSRSRMTPEYRMWSAIDRINKLSIPEPNSGCWLWTGCVDPRGYGKTAMGRGRAMFAHRLSFMAYRYDPGALIVMHKCDNSYCVNPDHLEAGTQRQNVRDCFRRGRARPRGKFAMLREHIINSPQGGATQEGTP